MIRYEEKALPEDPRIPAATITDASGLGATVFCKKGGFNLLKTLRESGAIGIETYESLTSCFVSSKFLPDEGSEIVVLSEEGLIEYDMVA